MSKNKNTYLVCPLNWGLGHASRMIPVIKQLQKDGYSVILGGDGMALELLIKEFPELEYIVIPDIQIKFNAEKNIFQLIKIAFHLILQTQKEHLLLKKLLKIRNIDNVISDNRYGLWNKKINSIIYTHQIMVKLPVPIKKLEFPVHCLLKKMLVNFDECRIPDYKNISKSLSGDLSHKYKAPKNAKFVGPLSRFSIPNETKITPNCSYDIVVVLSGPEPARSVLEHLLIEKLKNLFYSTLLIRGITNSNEQKPKTIKNITIHNTITSSLLKHYLTKANLIICRSGYSSIMDLHTLNLKALFIPTPGQTEQEYLARHNSYNNYFVQQNEVNYIQFLSILSDI